MKSKIIVPLLAAALLTAACSAQADTSNKTTTSQNTISKTDKEKIDKGIQNVVDELNAIFDHKSYIKQGYFSGKDYESFEGKINVVLEALNFKKKLDDNDEALIKKKIDKIIKTLDKLDYKQKKNFLANLDNPATIYNAVYRDDFHWYIYDFDYEVNPLDKFNSFIDSNTSDDVKMKEAMGNADYEYGLSKDAVSYFKSVEKSFKDIYGGHFNLEDRQTIITIIQNFKHMEVVYQLFVNNLRQGKQEIMEPEDAIKAFKKILKEQKKLVNQLDKRYKVPVDLDYDSFAADQDY